MVEAPSREELVAELEAELADEIAIRDRIVLNRGAHPEIDHHKVPAQLACCERTIARLRAMVAEAQA